MLLIDYQNYNIITELIDNGICQDNINLNWKPIESAIMRRPGYAHAYAKYVLKDRFIKAEKYIIMDPYFAFEYALDIIKGRWGLAEPTLIKNPYFAFMYTKFILKCRWIEAEENIMGEPLCWTFYAHEFNIVEEN